MPNFNPWMRNAENRVRHFATSHDLWGPGHSLVLAVSGGADSLCMLYLLAKLAVLDGFTVIAAHLNHGMRGDDAEADVRFVEEHAHVLGLTFVADRADVIAIGVLERVGIEDAGRRARRAFLDRVLIETGANSVATAHTRSDHVETILLNICRGSGLHGLAGIPARGFGRRIRPLLSLERQDTEEYCRLLGIEPRRDPSNEDLQFARNRIRHEVLPLLRQTMNPEIDDALVRLSNITSDALESLEGAAHRTFTESCTSDPCLFRRDPLSAVPSVVQAEAVRLILETYHRGPVGLTCAEVDRVCRLVTAGGLAPLSGGGVAEASGSFLRISRAAECCSATSTTSPVSVTLDGPGTAHLPGVGTLRADCSDSPPRMDQGASNQPKIHAALHLTLTVRQMRPGDRMRPVGRGGSRKLSDLFQEKRVPVWDRARWPVVADQYSIIWIPDIAVDERCVRPGSGSLLLTWEWASEWTVML